MAKAWCSHGGAYLGCCFNHEKDSGITKRQTCTAIRAAPLPHHQRRENRDNARYSLGSVRGRKNSANSEPSDERSTVGVIIGIDYTGTQSPHEDPARAMTFG